MKFLCVPCDRPMELLDKKGPDEGSVTLVFSCPACGYEFAMLTNAFETQLVSSLGVTIGPDGRKTQGESKCPFTGMIQEMTDEGGFPWTGEARERLETIPSFIRPMAKSGIEKFAREHGYARVDEKVLEEARAHFGM